MRKHDGRIGFLAVFLACMENISYLCSMKEIKVTGTVCPIEYWTEGEDWLDTHCILLPFFSIKSVEGCKLKRKPVKKAYRELYVGRRGNYFDIYTVHDGTRTKETIRMVERVSRRKRGR